jgi:hypothetical protein
MHPTHDTTALMFKYIMNRILLTMTALLLSGNHSITCIAAEASNLRLTTQPSNLSYCRNTIYDEEFDVLIRLRLTYTNTGRKPLILEKGPNLVTYWRAKRTPKELQSADFTHTLWITSDNEGVSESGDVPSANYVVLQPGESYVGEAEIHVPNAKALMKEGVIAGGAQYFQVVIPKWSGNEKQAGFLRERWKKVGWLWSGAIRSQPMLITIEPQPNVVECPRAA